ncbi:MAG: hypothetical protein D6718_11560 [Acidobacteria bacterium]|nr:MAG: hypothetical protein D6718_11560 [Acidobacteriota bacterium]
MRRIRWTLLVALAALAAPALAQEDAEATDADFTFAWGLSAGQVSGGRVSKMLFDGVPPRIDDTRMLHGLFDIVIAPRLDFEMRFGFGQTDMLDTPNGKIDTRLFIFDAGLVPHWSWGRFGFGVPLGLGWAVTQTDKNLADTIPGRSFDLSLRQGSGATMFLGLRGTLKVGEKWVLFGDLRARRFHRLVNVTERTVKSTEVTFGFLRYF